MKSRKESIVFIGSGPVATQCLGLLAKNFDIEHIITKPRPPHHKGSVPVIELGEELSIPIDTVTNKIELDELIKTKPYQSKLAVLIDFGIIVSQAVIDYFPLGIINSHFSVLPDLRGPDPITFAILSGQKQTGVSLMFLVAGMDEGPIAGYTEQELHKTVTTPELTKTLIYLSDALLTSVIPSIFSGEEESVPQSITKRSVSYSHKLSKDDGVLDWTKPAAQLEREIRAYIGWPGSRTQLAGRDVIITAAHVADTLKLKVSAVKIENKQLYVGTSTTCLAIDRVKPAGKSEMDITAFISGYGSKVQENN